MKPARFRYARPGTLDEALGLLADHADDGKLLAGGQSLVPMMNFRLAAPAVIVDIGAVRELHGIEEEGGTVVVRAGTRQRAVETSATVGVACPVVPAALAHVGHLQIRVRGTFGGSLAHADPAAELAAVALALDAELVVRSVRGERRIAATEFFVGPYMTTLELDEILTEVRMPVHTGRAWSFQEVARRRGDFALAGVCAVARNGSVALACFGAASTPRRLPAAESAVAEELVPETIDVAAEAAAAEIDPISDVHADERLRRRLVGELVRRTLTEVLNGRDSDSR
jgi:carbon-monoxide dehydrogenase medium subunit